jgi:hypothetical protein
VECHAVHARRKRTQALLEKNDVSQLGHETERSKRAETCSGVTEFYRILKHAQLMKKRSNESKINAPKKASRRDLTHCGRRRKNVS